jgi:hypothetical protein
MILRGDVQALLLRALARLAQDEERGLRRSAAGGGGRLGQSEMAVTAESRRRSLMTRIVLAALVLLNCTTELLAQAGQTVTPVPTAPPSLNTTSLTCQTNCDTQAMNCQNSCVPTTAAAATAGGTTTGACDLSCSTQQLVCKQRCGP